MPYRFLHHCHACGGDVPESIEHILRECPRWECHCRNFGTLAPEFSGFVHQLAPSPADINALLLGGVPPSLHGDNHFVGNGRFFHLCRQALPHIASMELMYRTPEMFCSVRWALLLLAILEWVDTRTGRADLS
jgi:hypothetical protein